MHLSLQTDDQKLKTKNKIKIYIYIYFAGIVGHVVGSKSFLPA